jgi:cytochrome P450
MTDTRPTIDFDHHAPRFATDGEQELRELRSTCPIAWTANHGGYWVVTNYELATTTIRDHETFTSGKYVDDDGVLRGGLLIPTQSALHAIPDESDPPEWNSYRRVLNPFFTPGAIDRRRPRFRQIIGEIVAGVAEQGEADLVTEINNPVMGNVTLDVIGLPTEEWPIFMDPIRLASYGHEIEEGRLRRGTELVYEKIFAAIDDRRATPRDDVLTHLVHSSEVGIELTDHERADMVFQILAGGLNSTATLLSSAYLHLEGRPDLHERILTDDAYLRVATEELVRWSSPVGAIARTVACPVQLAGESLEPGERVFVSYYSANHDDGVFERADEIDLERFPNKHAAFGVGIHRCLGSNLARAVFQETLIAVLRTMPDYVIDRGRIRRFPVMPGGRGYLSVPATFARRARGSGPVSEGDGA